MINVKFWGKYACFTRPECKVERISYPVITPSAARLMLRGIFWKPEMAWMIKQIHVMKPIQYESILRNEVIEKMSKAKQLIVEDKRTQRQTIALIDVEYNIVASIVTLPHATAPAEKYYAQAERRIAKGQCYYRPSFGLREFAASFCEAQKDEKPLDFTFPVGNMLFDNIYADKITPIFFNAIIKNGILDIPANLCERRLACSTN